jgi:hypothetical protein
LTIQGRALPVEETDALGYSSTIIGDFSIQLKTDGVLTAMDVYVEDKQYYGDLKAGPYTFTTKGTLMIVFFLFTGIK